MYLNRPLHRDVTWLHEIMAHVVHSHVGYVWHLQMGLFVNPILKRSPFRWQCTGSSPVSHCNWFSFNSFVLFFCEKDLVGIRLPLWILLGTVPDSLWQFLLRCRKLVQVLWADISYQDVASLSAVWLPGDPAPVSVELLCVASFTRGLW
jgi:hypothetical protein